MIETDIKIVFWYTIIFALRELYTALTLNHELLSEPMLIRYMYIGIGGSSILILLAIGVLLGSYKMINIRPLLIGLAIVYFAIAIYVIGSSLWAWNFYLFSRAIIITVFCMIPVFFIKRSFDVVI